LRRPLSSIFWAVVSGVLYFLSYCGFDQWYLSFFCLVPLLFVIEGQKQFYAFLLGWICGIATNGGGYYWIIHTISDFGHFPLPAAVGLTFVLWAWQGLSIGLFAWLVSRQPRDPTGILPAMCFIAVEFIFPFLFPSYIGCALYKVPMLVQVAELGGPLLVSFMLVYVNVAIYGLFTFRLGNNIYRPYHRVAAAIVLVVACALFGKIRIKDIEEKSMAAPSVKIGTVQANMGIFAKRENPSECLRRHLKGSSKLSMQQVDLIIWPEAAYMYFVPAGKKRLSLLNNVGINKPALIGVLRKDGEKRYNSAFLLDANGFIKGMYDKTYLLAFGEYIPFGDRYPQLYDYTPNTGHFTHGTSLKPVEFNGYRLSIMICYEDILPGFTRKLVSAGKPHLLVNLTNDAWFGDSNEPVIHMALASFRSIEHRRWMVRATNSGVSAIIDANGKIVERTGVFEQTTMKGSVAMLDLPPTVYGMTGDILGYAALLLVVAGFFWNIVQRKRLKRVVDRTFG